MGALVGKIAVVTGSTQGLGESVARKFCDEDVSGLIICGRNRFSGDALASELSSPTTRVIYVEADLRNLADAKSVIEAADRLFGRVDILVNAAGITDRGSILETTEDLFDSVFSVNVKAPFFLIQAAAQIMRRERISGSIINIQSMAAHGGTPFNAAYSASKGALATLTKNSAHALLRHRIRVNGLNVGWMSTPGEDRTMRRYHGASDDWLASASRAQPFGRLVDPAEIARLCLYLASEQSGLLTGSNIDFDQTVVGTATRPLDLPVD